MKRMRSFAKRDDGTQSVLSQKSLIVSPENILTYMGTENPIFMVIAILNRPAVFDDAALSRFGEQIKIGAPGLEEEKAYCKTVSTKISC